MHIVDFILHCNKYIGVFIQNYGNLIYPLIFVIIFCETGLVFLPFLPGDSLIFASGAFTAIGKMNFFLLLIIVIMAAILGDSMNYEIGKHFGKKILNGNHKLIKKENLDKANDLVKKYGGAAVFIARFTPIVRTIVPFVVGMGNLQYRKFIKYNALGAIIWVTLFLSLGYFFGNIPAVQNHFSLILLAIIFLSLLPVLIAWIKSKKTKNSSN